MKTWKKKTEHEDVEEEGKIENEALEEEDKR